LCQLLSPTSYRSSAFAPQIICCARFCFLLGLTGEVHCLLWCPCSVLEPGRSLTLAEKGGAGAELVVGAAGFLVLATMNPGGDFGKKELSPALSNRFTQVCAMTATGTQHPAAL
jgi:hypothetical protein